jgi:hypothetical protein
MSLPSVEEVRKRIEAIPDQSIQVCYKTTYLMCARIGEIISLKYPTDLTAHPTGSELEVQVTTYTPDLNNPKEFQTLVLARAMQGQQADLQSLAQIREPVAVFSVSTEKRQKWKRLIGLPLRKEFEPWTQELIDYFQEREGKDLFPFTRQHMYNEVRTVFAGLEYKIFPYKRVRLVHGQPIRDPKTNKTEKYQVIEHLKPFRNHALRHLRNVELRDFYGLSAEERSSYGGWKLSTMIGGIGSSIDRYGEAAWKPYFPKLLKTHNSP